METITIQTETAELTEEQFFHLCSDNKGLRFERDKNKNIILMAPTGFYSSSNEIDVEFQLELWNRKKQEGYVTGASGGYILPNGAMRAPDAAWTKKERIDRLTDKEKERFPHLCPDFVIEIRSKSDTLKMLQEKMQEWMENGCRLGWLIDVENKRVFIYRNNGTTEAVHSFKKKLSGEEVLPGLKLDLSELK